MKRIVILSLLFAQISMLKAIEINADLFTYDEEKVEFEFTKLSDLEDVVRSNPNASFSDIFNLCPHFKKLENSSFVTPYSLTSIAAPGSFPSFWFAFTFSAIGTYFIYGVVAGPITVGIVYFSTDRDRTETKKAIWGCLVGTVLGAGIKYAVVNLL